MHARRIAVDMTVTTTSVMSGRMSVGGPASTAAASVTKAVAIISAPDQIAIAVTTRPGKPLADGTIDVTRRNRSPTCARSLSRIAAAETRPAAGGRLR